MFDTIILLTGPAEQTVLASVLRRNNPQLTIRMAASRADIDALEPGVLARARLIGFVTPVVVPKRILDALGFGAYNFHPGPPHYPGWLPAHFATYDRAAEFGATVHVMIERVDAGPIVGVERFRIPPHIGVAELERLAYVEIARLFWSLAPALAEGTTLAELPIQWSGRKSTRRMHASLCDISADISENELNRRIDAFGAGHFGASPTITLHGPRVRYIELDAVIETASAAIVTQDQPEVEAVTLRRRA
jgi:methionyl-tRNA formyltransferase